jgi:hypothetical protein
LTLVGQRLAGIRNQGNILATRGLRSTNRVPAIVAEGANLMLSLLDSTLAGGSPDQPAIRADGGVYCLRLRTEGYPPKTEYESQKLLAETGAATEILGAFIYPLGEIPADRPIFENRDSRIALVYGTSIYHANHQLHIRDVRGNESKTVGNDALQWSGSRARMDLYTSDASLP